jgi:hypothetical protein
MAAGFSADECRQIRRLDEDTLHDHLLRAAREGHEVPARWVLSPEQMAAIESTVGQANGDAAHLQTALSRLPPGVKYRDVQLYLLSRK